MAIDTTRDRIWLATLTLHSRSTDPSDAFDWWTVDDVRDLLDDVDPSDRTIRDTLTTMTRYGLLRTPQARSRGASMWAAPVDGAEPEPEREPAPAEDVDDDRRDEPEPEPAPEPDRPEDLGDLVTTADVPGSGREAEARVAAVVAALGELREWGEAESGALREAAFDAYLDAHGVADGDGLDDVPLGTYGGDEPDRGLWTNTVLLVLRDVDVVDRIGDGEREGGWRWDE